MHMQVAQQPLISTPRAYSSSSSSPFYSKSRVIETIKIAMDPLTVGTTVADILSGTTRITMSISDYITTTKNAPKEISELRIEVARIRVVLQQLQALLLRVETIYRISL
ncbi:unnamed protein product [Sphagnum balticum]